MAKVKKLEKKISAMDKKADDWSGDAGSTGFQDIGNAISDGVGAVGDAIGNAFDWAQQQSQGENGTFDSIKKIKVIDDVCGTDFWVLASGSDT